MQEWELQLMRILHVVQQRREHVPAAMSGFRPMLDH
jgi:hypothetical protein